MKNLPVFLFLAVTGKMDDFAKKKSKLDVVPVLDVRPGFWKMGKSLDVDVTG